MKSTVYILDISNMMHRAFHVHNLSTSYGLPVGAIFGTLSMMLRFLEKYRPTHFLVCYDAQTSKSLRKDMYPLYKANRVHVNSISAEESTIRKLLSLLNFPSVELEGYEADDLIATATSSLKNDADVVIVTSDKDMLQLIEPGVKVFDSMKNVWYDESEAFKKFGVKASQISDFLAIAGDSVDNIPGVKGIGAKGAARLLSEYESVEDIYKNIENIELKTKKKLEDSRDNAEISKKLSSLIIAPVDIDLEFTKLNLKDGPEIWETLNELEFTDIKDKLKRLIDSYK